MVEPEATEVGPVIVTVGAVPLLWQDVQVEPLLPEKPEMPLLVALAGIDEANVSRTIQKSATTPVRCLFRCLAGINAAGTTLAA